MLLISFTMQLLAQTCKVPDARLQWLQWELKIFDTSKDHFQIYELLDTQAWNIQFTTAI